MAWKLWLDDERPAPKNHLHARNYPEALGLMDYMKSIKEGWPRHVSFDHDLGPGATGYDLACYFEKQVIEEQDKLPDNFTFSIHSANPVGRNRIRQVMSRLGQEV